MLPGQIQPAHLHLISLKLTGTKLFQLFQQIEDSAGGLDGFVPLDMKLFSPMAAEMLAEL